MSALDALIQHAYRGDSARRGWTHEADLLGGQRTDAAMLRDIIADKAHCIIVAEHNGALCGCVQLQRATPQSCYLGLLTVDPALQSGGLGRALLEAAERRAVGDGATAMELTVIAQRRELIAWYVRRGYALTGEERPFPLDDARFGLPVTRDLRFLVLARTLVDRARVPMSMNRGDCP